MRPMRTPNGYTFDVSLKRPALLMVRTTWLPGWNVRIDAGRPTQALCANHWMPAVAVPPGKHEIAFYYRPRHFKAAMLVTLVTCIVLLGQTAMRRRVRHRERTQTRGH